MGFGILALSYLAVENSLLLSLVLLVTGCVHFSMAVLRIQAFFISYTPTEATR